jgi:hypothetical protein
MNKNSRMPDIAQEKSRNVDRRIIRVGVRSLKDKHAEQDLAIGRRCRIFWAWNRVLIGEGIVV